MKVFLLNKCILSDINKNFPCTCKGPLILQMSIKDSPLIYFLLKVIFGLQTPDPFQDFLRSLSRGVSIVISHHCVKPQLLQSYYHCYISWATTTSDQNLAKSSSENVGNRKKNMHKCMSMYISHVRRLCLF